MYESRQYDGQIWRRRACLLCHKVYVTCETGGANLRMPAETQSRNRSKAAEHLTVPRHEGMPSYGDGGSALAAAWGGNPFRPTEG